MTLIDVSQSGLPQCPGKSEAAETLLARLPTIEQFVRVYNVAMQERCATSPMRCFTGSAPTLAALVNAYGRDNAKRWLFGLLGNLSRYAGGNAKDWSVEALQEMAGIILTEYYYLNAAEVLLFFYRFKVGKYGKFYKGFEALTVMEALSTFISERAIIKERHERDMMLKEQDEWIKTSIDFAAYSTLKDRAIHRDKDAAAILGFTPEQIAILRRELAGELWKRRRAQQNASISHGNGSNFAPNAKNEQLPAKEKKARKTRVKIKINQ